MNDLVLVDWKKFGDLHLYERFWWCGNEYFKSKLVDGELIAKPVPGQNPKPMAQLFKYDTIVEIKIERVAIEDYIRFKMKRSKQVERDQGWIRDGF